MKIQFVISGLGPGGAERQVVLLACEYRRQGHEVAIYALTRTTTRAGELEGSGVALAFDQKRTRLDFGVIRRLRRQLAGWRPDVVHSFLYDGDIYARLAAIGLGIPVIGSERSSNYHSGLIHRLGYALTRGLSRGLIANSHVGARFAARLHGLPPDRVAVVFNGIDLDEVDRRVGAGRNRAESLCPGAGLRRVCVVGSIRQSKDHVLALQTAAVALTRDPGLRFIFVGAARVDAGSAYEQRVMAEHRRLGLESQVLFVGHRNDVYEIIASSDALLVTSAREGFPNVVLEAMACGTPVASTDYSDVRRILPLAWQVDAERDPATLAAILARCISERPVVAAAQRQWVERHASIGASARAMLDAYRAFGVAQARLETA